MERLTLLLFLIASLSSTTALLVVLVDSSKCVHLRCEWRGVGKHCKSATLFHRLNQQKSVSDATPLNYPQRSDDEPETSILVRIQSLYPVNTFTLVDDDVAMGEQCKGRRLWCNDSGMYVAEDYDSFLKLIQKHAVPPKLQC
uniref:Uncharacterized protein n=1 Tax=Caenorhabditis japonica TaxID=281687 RepID=A0A8R1IJM6_CAEJA